MILEDQCVEASAAESLDRILWPADNWLLNVERRVQEHRHSGDSLELADQLPVTRVSLSAHRLRACRAIHVHDCWNSIPLFFGDAENRHHKWIDVRLPEDRAALFLKHRRRKRPKPLAEFHLVVE